MLQSHGYAADCACPVCADHRVETKHGFVLDYINWANGDRAPGGLITRARRVEPGFVNGLDIPFQVWKSAGLPVNKRLNPSLPFRVGADARA